MKSGSTNIMHDLLTRLACLFGVVFGISAGIAMLTFTPSLSRHTLFYHLTPILAPALKWSFVGLLVFTSLAGLFHWLDKEPQRCSVCTQVAPYFVTVADENNISEPLRYCLRCWTARRAGASGEGPRS